MEIVTPVAPAEVKQATVLDEFEALFDELLTKNYITRDVTIGSNLKLTLKALSSADILEADTVYVASIAMVPQDIINRVRMVSQLAYAVEKVNDKKVIPDDADREKIMTIRNKIHTTLMKLPPFMIDNLMNTLRDINEEQMKLFEEADKKIENF